ncbi:hypothetical protein ABZ725_43380 [Streptomyces sp. NPDC006872]|uniref:hypothetical protein n=1 Tax=Streptomyces sp. NPDC006872 TaxID=3155720 RepID=UPI0033EE5FE4
MSPVDRQGQEPSSQLKWGDPEPAGVVQYEFGGAWGVVASGAYDMNSLGPPADASEAAGEEHSRVVLVVRDTVDAAASA